ncbi:MAG: Sedolisin [Pedosphaera sp.]|nr:Sedolisin [Pedosphaera sp.]
MGKQILSGHRPAQTANVTALGQLPGTDQLHLAIGLPLRNRETLTNLLGELYDPTSPNYHKWLSSDDFRSQFSPTEEDYEAVTSFLRAQGLTITATYSSRVLVDVAGSVADVQKAFSLNLLVYPHPEEPSRTFFAPDQEPSLGLNKPVLHISGLDNYSLPRPASLVVMPAPQPQDGPKAQSGSGPSGSYRGGDFRAAYAAGVGLTGVGQYVGLLQFDGYFPSDITTYASLSGLTNLPLQNILLNGKTGSAGANNVEVALDIEMALAMAPGLAGVIVYEGNIGNSILGRMASDNLAKQLSASWTFPTDATTPQIFQQFAAQGQAYFNAAGDSGAYAGTPSSPTDSPYVTSVGGTTLSTRGPGQGWLSEKTWSWFTAGTGNGASSGGVSTSWPIPVWQQGLSMTANHGSTTLRNIPDVSMVSDNVFVVSDNGAQSFVGGDSVASPLWAAFIALVNQQAALNNQPPVGFINPAIYAIGKGANFTADFHDITVGNNTNASSPAQFFAVGGYDLCTGWGTPAGKPLINALAPPTNAAAIIAAGTAISVETCSPTNGTINPDETVVVNFSLQNIGLVNTASLVATLQSNVDVTPLSGPQTYGAVLGGGAAVTRSFIFTAHGSCGGTISPTLQLQDGATVLSNVVLTLPLGAPLLAYSQNFDGVTAPTFPPGWSRSISGTVSNWINSTSFKYSGANALSVGGSTNAGVSDVNSPSFLITSPTAQLSFRNSYSTEIDPTNSANAFDGGVLEIKIGAGTFTDILAAGGSFVGGGYVRTLDLTSGNPLAGRQVWAGTSGNFLNTVVNLPAAAAGQTVQLKWRLAVDIGNAEGATFWYLDNISVRDGTTCCTPAASADLAISQSVFPDPAMVGQGLAYSLAITNLGPGPATSVAITNVLPPNSTFSFASPGCVKVGNNVICSFPLLLNGGVTNFTILVVPTTDGLITNTVSIASTFPDANSTNNTSTKITTVYGPPAISSQPSNVVSQVGANVSFGVAATGTGPLGYQWLFGGTNLNGATASTLQLTNVQPSQAGVYAVAVTNFVGAITSADANLKVLVPPTIALSSLNVTATNVAISLLSVPGLNYTLEYKNSLTDAVWTPLFPAQAGTGLMLMLQDTNGAAVPYRFYRVNCN